MARRTVKVNGRTLPRITHANDLARNAAGPGWWSLCGIDLGQKGEDGRRVHALANRAGVTCEGCHAASRREGRAMH